MSTPLEGDDTVLDAGCGTGRVTELLLARLPRGRVVALDASASMLEQARGRLARFGDRVTYVRADLEQPLPIDEPVDAVLSTATFHWVPDHDALFANLAAVLRPGGMLVAQCGGFGNVPPCSELQTDVHPGFHRSTTSRPPKRRATGSAIRVRRIETWLSDARTVDTPAQSRPSSRTVCLRTFLDELPAEAREPFVKAVAARMPELTLDYVRLNITARRAATSVTS